MPGGGVQVTGLAALQRDLRTLGVELNDLTDVMGDLAAQGARLAASFAPRRTGTLAAAIRGSHTSNAAVVTVDAKRVPYAGVINYGWRKHNIAPARFMQHAAKAMRPQVTKHLSRAITKLIEQKGLS